MMQPQPRQSGGGLGGTLGPHPGSQDPVWVHRDPGALSTGAAVGWHGPRTPWGPMGSLRVLVVAGGGRSIAPFPVGGSETQGRGRLGLGVMKTPRVCPQVWHC